MLVYMRALPRGHRMYLGCLDDSNPWPFTLMFIGRTDAKAETPILWLPDVKSQIIGKDPDAGKDEGRRRKEWQ